MARRDALLRRHPVRDHRKLGLLWTPDAMDLYGLHTDSELRRVSARGDTYMTSALIDGGAQEETTVVIGCMCAALIRE